MKFSPPKSLKGEVRIPGDKSISHRAVMIGSLAKGETLVENFLPAEDCLRTVACFSAMGINIDQKSETRLLIKGKGLYALEKPKDVLYVGNSGTTIRILLGILAGQKFDSTITGDESVCRRPMLRVVEPLRLMKASIEGKNGGNLAPLTIHGQQLRAISYELPVASAQVKSALLLAGLYAEGETKIIEKLISRDHSERMLEYFGAKIRRENAHIYIEGGKEFRGGEVSIPGDISSAAFIMVAASLVPGSEILLRDVGVNPTRTGIIEVLHRMGADLEVKDEEILSEEPRANILIKDRKLKGITICGGLIPRIIDELPVIAVAATQAEGMTIIKDAKELRVKESDRIATISSELKKLGAKIQEKEDGMVIYGPTKLKGSTVISYGDHRVAMSMAVAGLIAEGETIVEDTECIKTSFPGFEEILSTISVK